MPAVSPDEYLRRLGHPEVRPGGEVEVSDGAHRVAPHHAELVDVPVGEVGLIHDGHLQLSWSWLGYDEGHGDVMLR